MFHPTRLPKTGMAGMWVKDANLSHASGSINKAKNISAL